MAEDKFLIISDELNAPEEVCHSVNLDTPTDAILVEAVIIGETKSEEDIITKSVDLSNSTSSKLISTSSKACSTVVEKGDPGKSAYQSYLDTTTDNPKLTEAEWSSSITRIIQIKIISDITVLTIANAIATLTIPIELNGSKLIRAEMAVKNPSSSGEVSVMVRNITTTNNMLTTPITIDESELNSYTAVTPSVVNSLTNTIFTGNTIAIDVISAGIGTKGGDIILSFNK